MAAVAPYQVHVVPLTPRSEAQMSLAEGLYDRLGRHGVEVLLDDREERAGVKLNDADLIGIPHRIIVGRFAEEGNVEWQDRRNGTVRRCPWKLHF